MRAMFAMGYRVVVLLALVATSCADSMDDPMDGHGLSLPGRSLSEGTVGASYRELIAAGGDAAGRARWELSAGALPPGLSLTSMAGPMGEISGRPTIGGRFDFTLAVTAGGSRAAQPFRIIVGDALAIDGALGGAVEGQPYRAALQAIAGRGQHHAWTVAGLPDGLTATPDGRTLTIDGVSPPGRFSVSVSVSDDAGGQASRSIELAVTSSLSISGELAPGRSDQLYTAALTVHGGIGSGYHWSLGSAAPGGLALSSVSDPKVNLAGVLAAGHHVIPVTVTDDSQARADHSFTLDVFDPLMIDAVTAPGARVGEAYSLSLTARGGTGPAPRYDWSVVSETLPPGLRLTASTGASVDVAGTPAAAGTFEVTIEVTSDDERVTASFQIVVGNNPPTITTTAVPDATFGIAYDVLLQVRSPAGGPVAWRVVSGELPPGLVVTPGATGADGRLAGAPQLRGSFTVTVEVRDAGGSDSQELTIRVGRQDRLDIAAAVWPRARVGEPYAVSATALDAHGAVTWSIAGGELPAGIALDPTRGTLNGTPTAAGFHRLVLRAVDEDGRTAARELVLAVNGDRSFAIMTHSETFSGQYTASVRELTGGHPGDLIDVTPRIDGFMTPDAFSPGGTWASIRAAEGSSLYLLDLRSDLEPARLLTTQLRRDRSAPARFSPDDAFVAWPVESPSGSFRFTWTISDLRGAAPVTVASIPDAGYDLAWSPDGRKLFVTSATGHALHVWDGTAVNDIALPAPLRAFSELWAPDSSALVMVANGGGTERAYLVPIDGSRPPLSLTPSSLFLNGNFLTSSPDGATVLVDDQFTSNPTTHHLAIDLRGTQPAQALTVADLSNATMAWSPDSTQLMLTYDLFLSTSLGSMSLIARDAIGAAVPAPVDLSGSGGVVEWGQWSADGQYFGYTAPQGLVELPVRTAGTPRLITPDDVRDFDWRSLSPRRRAYVVVHGGVSLSFIDLAQGDAQVIRIDSDDTAPIGPSADWRVASQLQAVEWATYVTAPHTVRMSDLSAGSPGASMLLLAFGTGVVRTLITP